PRYVFVADSLNIVPAIAVVIKRRTLYRLETHHPNIGPHLLEPVACRDRSRAAHRRTEGLYSAISYSLFSKFGRKFDDGVTCYMIMKAVVAHYLELVQDADSRVPPEFPGLVVNFLYV